MTRNPLFIANPRAGDGRTGRLLPKIRVWLAERGAGGVLSETRERGEAQRLAAAAAGKGHDRVVVVGGDGTFQEVINGLLSPGLLSSGAAGSVLALGLVPGGRGNDVARGLGLPANLQACLQIALGAATRAFDVAQATGEDGRERWFAAAGGAGFDAQVAHTMENDRRFWMRGEAGYLLATLNELRRTRNHELAITLRDSQGEHRVDGRFLFVAFANGPSYGGGMRICPAARTDDGLLDVCLVGDLSRFAALKELPGIYQARHVGHPKVHLTQVRSLRIEGEAGIRAHLDGEPFGTLPLEIGLRPVALQVACGAVP